MSRASSKWWSVDFPFQPHSGRFFYGWWIVAASTIGMLFSIPGQTMGFSVFTEILMADLGLSRVALSAAYCVGTVGSGLTLPALGRLYDWWGGRKLGVVSVVVTGFVLFYLSSTGVIQDALSGFLPDRAAPLVGFVLIGLGFYLIRMSAQGVLTMCCRNLIGKWFDHRRGLAFAISGIAVSFAFSVAPKVLDSLIVRFGHEGAWIVLGLLSVGFMAPVAWLVFRDTPEECGMVMDGRTIVDFKERNEDMIIHREYTRAEAVRTFTFWAFCLSFGFFSFFSTAFTFHIVSIGEEFDFSKSRILGLFIPMAVISLSTSLLCGWINPYIRLKWLLLGMNIGAVIGAAGLLTLNTTPGIWAYVIGNGLCGGGFMSVSGLVWPRFFGRKWLGSISGVNMSLIVIASGIGPLLFGVSEQLAGSYFPVLCLCVALPAFLAVGSVFADNPQRKNKA